MSLVPIPTAITHRRRHREILSKTYNLLTLWPKPEINEGLKGICQWRQPRNRRGWMPWPNPQTSIPYGMSHLYHSPYTDRSRRNICMRRWNEAQPGGQGLLTEFELYFKSLSMAATEVRPPSNVFHPFKVLFLFKKELRGAQTAAVSTYLVHIDINTNLIITAER